MCFGLPIITSNTVAASRDLVRQGANGYTFPPGDVPALTACLETLLGDTVSRQAFGECSREIIAQWNHDRTVRGILDALAYLDDTSATRGKRL